MSVLAAVTPAAFRARFPMLARTVHLASCSLGARSLELDAAIARMLDAMTTGGAPWAEFEQQVSEARHRFAALIGARPDQVAVVPNASVGAFQVASTRDWRARPRIVTTAAEFPSIAQVWLAQRACGADVSYAERTVDSYIALIDSKTRLVSVPLIGYQDAARLPVAEVARVAHAAGAEVFVDAYQAKYHDYPRLGSVVGYSALMSIADGLKKAGSTDPDKLAAAFKGLSVDTPFGPITFRAQDNQSTMGAYVGVTGVKDGKGIMTSYRYIDGASVQPSDADVKKLRPAQ